MVNRILAAYERNKALVESRQLTAERAESLSRALDIDLEEFIAFNNVRAQAQAGGRISYEESTVAYEYLHSVDAFNKAPLYAKVTLTALLRELLAWSINQRKQLPMASLPDGNGFDHINTATPSDD